MRIFNCLIVPKNLKEGILWDFLTFVLLQNINKLKGGPFEDIRNFRKKVSQSRKSENLLLRNICKKKLAHTHGSNTNPVGWKASILPLDHERLNYATCGLKRERCRAEKKHPHFPITLAYRKCNNNRDEPWWLRNRIDNCVTTADWQTGDRETLSKGRHNNEALKGARG